MLLSRVADALYWMGRYLERAEHAARVIDVRLELGLDRRAFGVWDFARLYDSLQLTNSDTVPSTPAALVDSLVLDAGNRQSVVASVTGARENARQVREEISSDMWEQINGLYLRLKDARAEGTWSVRPHYLSRLVIEGVHLFQGTTDATMGQAEGYQYLRLGRFLERADATAALLDFYYRDLLAASGGAANLATSEWAGLLRSCSALEAFCRVYTADLRPDRIAEFLLLNPEFPRSLRFAAASVEASLRTIAGHVPRRTGGRAERLAGRLHASLDYAQVDEILADNPHAYLTNIGRQCEQIHTAIYQAYIAYPIETALTT